MPGFGAWPLVFVCLVPLFLALRHGGGFRAGVWFGLTFFLVDLRWLLTLARFHPIVVPGVILLCAAYAALLGILVWGIERATRGATRAGLLFVAPGIFALAEMLRAQGPFALGFSTWYSALYRVPELIQSAGLFGPYAVSFLIVAVNAAIGLAVARRRPRYAAVAAGLLLLMAAPSFAPDPPDNSSLEVAVVSSTVRQETKLDARNLEALRARYQELGRMAASLDPDLIVYPESFLPSFILRKPDLLGDLQGVARLGGAQVLFGTGEYIEGNLYNRIALLSATGALEGTYDMVRLVPFGEYIPGRAALERLGLGDLARSVLPRDVTPGDAFTPLRGIGTPICFESTFPVASRGFVRGGADLLVVITNDAWFAGSSELEAHAAAAVFRAVETDRWVVQSSNGGVSGLITPDGHFIVSTEEEEVVAGTAGRRTTTTLYARIGDAPLVGLAAIAGVVGLGLALRRTRRTEGGE